MTDTPVLNKVQACVAAVTGRAPGDIPETAHLFEDLGMESLDFVDLLYSLERAFQTRFDMIEIAEKYHSSRGRWDIRVSDLCRLVSGREP